MNFQEQWKRHCHKHQLQEEFNTYASLSLGLFVSLLLIGSAKLMRLPSWTAYSLIFIGAGFFLIRAAISGFEAKELDSRPHDAP